ncbi:hypothetical protein, partial [Streptomyces mesophilus]|uniref:hypothetical protein n=1 Tax=Streptomyces mesophilus TaxID=1775132 RepID=UPI00332FEEE8
SWPDGVLAGGQRKAAAPRCADQCRTGWPRCSGAAVDGAAEGYPTQKERAVTPEKSKSEQRSTDRRRDQLGSLEVWARSAPIRLAGYEDDLAEPHILPSVD